MWTFNSDKLQSGINQSNFERDLFVESFLEMLQTTKEMEGTYECTAENKANTTSSSATLQVFGRSNDNNDNDGSDTSDSDDDDEFNNGNSSY